LLSPEELILVRNLAAKSFPSMKLLFQNSLSSASVSDWINVLSQTVETKDHRSIEIDYDIYGAGEANLAWLDEEIEFRSGNHASLQVASDFIDNLTRRITSENYPIGHLKFLLSYGNKSHKISFTTLADKSKNSIDTSEKADTVHLVVNARIQSTPDELRQMVVDELELLQAKNGITYLEKCVSCFSPGFPNPTHRVA
jgi:hypothetical protein